MGHDEEGQVNPGFNPDPEEPSPPPAYFTEAPPDLETSSPNKKASTSENPEVGVPEEEEEEVRQNWANPVEFLMSCLAMSVGLGNVWRFPFTAYDNGGGAFLIPYFIVLFFIGRPIYYMEICLGQFASKSMVPTINSMVPMFKGVGYGGMIAMACILSYYCSIIAQTIFYFFASFSKTLPWSTCDKDWGVCFENGTVNPELSNSSTAELYYLIEVVSMKGDIKDGLGTPEWRLSLCLVAAWLVIFLAMVKGVQSSGKVAYFTALFPYVVLFILLIRGVTLDGAGEGLIYFIKPQWEKLYKPEVWYAAVGQCFFSLGTGIGVVIMLSSFNGFRHNVGRDVLILAGMDTFTSLLAGCTIFSVLGYLSKRSGKKISEVTTGGAGLAFIAYPDAIQQFPSIPQLFAVLFFLMLFTLGVGSAVSLAGGIVHGIADQFPHWNRTIITGVVCVIGILLGLMYLTPGGGHMIDLIDYFGGTFILFVIGMIEVMVVSWIYGLNNFCRDVEFMLGGKVHIYWKVCWGFFIPVGLFAIFIYNMATLKALNPDIYPSIAIVCGWLLFATAILVIPAFGIHSVLTRKSLTLKEKFMETLRPSKHWGPKSSKIRKEWVEYKKNN